MRVLVLSATGAVNCAEWLLMNLPPVSTPRTRSLIALGEAVCVRRQGGRGALAAPSPPEAPVTVAPVPPLRFRRDDSRDGSKLIGVRFM